MSFLTPQFGWVCAAGVASFAVHNVWMAVQVGNARKKYGVKYPTMYADASHANANAFNCIQRAHQNSIENLPSFLSLLVLGGLQYPITAASAGAVYLLGRILYFNGYATGDPQKRMQGGVGYLGLFTLLGCVAKTAYDLLSKQ